MLYGRTSITLEDINASLNSKKLQKKVMEHHGSNGEDLVARGRSSEKETRGRSKGQKANLLELQLGRPSQEGLSKAKRKARRALGERNSSGGKSTKGRKVLMANGNTCDVVGVREVRIKLHTGSEMLLVGVRHVSRLKKNMILLGTLDKLGYKYRDGGDLLGTDKVEKHKLHTCDNASKFLISNVVFDVPTLVKQIESTCRGQVEKPRRKLGLGPKDPVTQSDMEIIHGRFEWRSKSLRWNSLQAGDEQSEQLRPRERYGPAKLVVSYNAEVRNTTCHKVSFRGCTKVKLRKPSTLEKSDGGLNLSDRRG
ncbi:hypothetical protein CRG98_008823 [Punica granatum]|uniref:Retrovirus-related Pol polyprotein from transposon TNT 1-94-like beta-barrel domain-containing protein n=1 Tax=Punica granatum TaxID=22663 RepID=A0A2I0KR79_PUNGR|nr:hypothetical protein CRG98_008823 [Punica granatum]